MKKEAFIRMKLSKISYSFAQARKNMFRNGLMTVASLFTIISCLIILGVFTTISLNVNYITHQVKDQCEVQLFLDETVSDERLAAVKGEIESLENVKETVLFTKEEMFEFAKNDMFQGEEHLLAGLEGDDNPFSDSYKITLLNIEQTPQTVTELSKIQDVSHIENKQDVVNVVVSFSDMVKKLSFGIMILLFTIAVVIISNTVKLTVFNRRKEINIMKYIGATDRFIRIPFILEGLLLGILSAAVAIALVSWGYLAIVNFMKANHFNMFELMNYMEIIPVLIVAFFAVGSLIGIFGSFISMRKYLRA